MACVLGAMLPLTIAAQTAPLSLYSVAGTVETPVTALYNFGNVAAGSPTIAHFRARNTGATAVVVANLVVIAVSNQFAIVNTSSPPYTIAPNNVLPFDFYVQFTAAAPATYSASVQVTLTVNGAPANGINLQLAATAIPAPILTVGAPCSGPGSTGSINFGNVQQGSSSVCTFSLSNSYSQPIAISTFSLSSGVFQSAAPVGAPLNLGAGQTVTFSITFVPPGSIPYSTTLTVGSQTFTLTGTGYPPPLSTPSFVFDSSTFMSGEQHTLSLHLPTPAPIQASGLLTLTFAPSIAAVSDDTTVAFVATNTRTLSFAVNQGSTDIQLNNQPSVTFATGTTAGTITFTFNPGGYGTGGSYPPAVIAIVPAPISVETASATTRANELDITVVAFDNTYSTGAMGFTFYNTTGQAIGGMIAANFAQQFSAYYQAGPPAGSSFLMRVSFPVTGDVTQIGAVDVTLTNSAGSVQLPRLNFP